MNTIDVCLSQPRRAYVFSALDAFTRLFNRVLQAKTNKFQLFDLTTNAAILLNALCVSFNIYNYEDDACFVRYVTSMSPHLHALERYVHVRESPSKSAQTRGT